MFVVLQVILMSKQLWIRKLHKKLQDWKLRLMLLSVSFISDSALEQTVHGKSQLESYLHVQASVHQGGRQALQVITQSFDLKTCHGK